MAARREDLVKTAITELSKWYTEYASNTAKHKLKTTLLKAGDTEKDRFFNTLMNQKATSTGLYQSLKYGKSRLSILKTLFKGHLDNSQLDLYVKIPASMKTLQEKTTHRGKARQQWNTVHQTLSEL